MKADLKKKNAFPSSPTSSNIPNIYSKNKIHLIAVNGPEDFEDKSLVLSLRNHRTEGRISVTNLQ